MHVYIIRSYFVTFEHKLELKIPSYFDDALTMQFWEVYYT